MPDAPTAPSLTHPSRMKLESYSAELRLENLSLGVDNIHYDVFLSPRFVEFSRKYLFDLVRLAVNIPLLQGKDHDRERDRDRQRRHTGAPEHAAFRRLLSEV
ncbi:MAG: hypothetical protein WBS18_09655, partial [Candidatus Acidiferrales bacterium]